MFSKVVQVYDEKSGTHKPYVPLDEFYKAMVFEGLYDLSREDAETFERLKSIFVTWMCEVITKYDLGTELLNDIDVLLYADGKELKEYFDEVDKEREQKFNEQMQRIIEQNAAHHYNVKHKKHLKLVK